MVLPPPPVLEPDLSTFPASPPSVDLQPPPILPRPAAPIREVEGRESATPEMRQSRESSTPERRQEIKCALFEKREFFQLNCKDAINNQKKRRPIS